MYKQIRGVKIMEIKKVLQKLNNQYFKSLKRFEKAYRLNDTYYAEKLKEFNNDYLKIVSAVINHDTYGLDLKLKIRTLKNGLKVENETFDLTKYNNDYA